MVYTPLLRRHAARANPGWHVFSSRAQAYWRKAARLRLARLRFRIGAADAPQVRSKRALAHCNRFCAQLRWNFYTCCRTHRRKHTGEQPFSCPVEVSRPLLPAMRAALLVCLASSVDHRALCYTHLSAAAKHIQCASTFLRVAGAGCADQGCEYRAARAWCATHECGCATVHCAHPF
jgi:hypothetical protein